jgi:hypothetical protein
LSEERVATLLEVTKLAWYPTTDLDGVAGFLAASCRDGWITLWKIGTAKGEFETVWTTRVSQFARSLAFLSEKDLAAFSLDGIV